MRELRNLVERLMIMAPGDEIIQRDLPSQMRSESTDHIRLLLLEEDSGSLRQASDAFEKRFIERKLRQHGGNVSRAARAFDLERSSLYRKIRVHGIEIERG